jgi:alkylation response protein AidB-like acyl-CoA dehydrogenase
MVVPDVDARDAGAEAMTALESLADRADAERAWPAASWAALREAGGLRWIVPADNGGDGLEGPELLERYEALAGTCMTTCFLLSQRDAACRRLRDHGSDELRRELLPPLARGERFATVGLSQLTTSRQHLGPTLTARLIDDGVVLDGSIPWVTGACRAEHIVVGAVLEDRRQVLLVLPTDLPGVRVGESLDLMALVGSMTAEVHCDRVSVPRRWLLAGPAEQVMPAGRGGSGGLETSCLALGLAGAAIAYLRREAEVRAPLAAPAERLEQKLQRLRTDLHVLAQGKNTPDAAAFLRGRANTLVLQATQAALTASKGTGFVHPHPAQRWARQALFFLVWSCPWPAAAATLEFLSDATCPG